MAPTDRSSTGVGLGTLIAVPVLGVFLVAAVLSVFLVHHAWCKKIRDDQG